MNDVVGEVVLAISDEDLLTEDLVGAITLRLGLGTHGGQVGTGLRLRQVHGAGPFAGDHLGQIHALLLIRAAQHERLDCTTGQHRAQREGHVGRLPHLHHASRQQLGQALTTVFGVARKCSPPRFGELLVGVLPAWCGRDFTVAPFGTLLVTSPVQRGQHAGRKLVGLLENCVHEVGRHFLVARQLDHGIEVGEFVHDELHVTERGVVVAHQGRRSREGVLSRYGFVTCRSGNGDRRMPPPSRVDRPPSA